MTPRLQRHGAAASLILVLVCARLALPESARAELLYFRNGGRVQAPATLNGDQVLIELPEGTHEFRREDFRAIVPGFSPQREWVTRLREARAATAEKREEAIRWAVENGLMTQAAHELQALHAEHPERAATRRMAAAMKRLESPCADTDVARFQQALGVSMSLARGPHVVLLHQQTEAEAEERIALLESVITAYYLTFADQGLELKTPARRLVFAWFANQKDYLAFLKSNDAAAFSTTRGYFHPTWNAVVAHDGRGSELQRAGRETAAARRRELHEARRTVETLPPRARLRMKLDGEGTRTLGRAEARSVLDRVERELTRDELLLELARRAMDDGTAAHEMVHLLAANSGLLPRHDAFPIWLQEGLAMQFEVVRGSRWAGVSRAHDLRLPDWRRIQPPSLLEPLVRDAGLGRGYRRDPYAQSWALVYYLRSARPAQFLTFLDLLRSPDAASAALSRTDRWTTAFARAFGSDLAQTERDWHSWMSTVQTPLELHAP